jgi:1-acyl-sn-glycerol-3-phosphate acyltransferase
MQPVVSEKPYEFVPPYHGTLWPRILTLVGRRKLRREYGIEGVEVEGADRLRQSLAAGHGVLLAPNHCRPCDPFVVSEMCRQVETLPFIMASAHLFVQGRLQAFLLRRAGAFSIYREGLDRQALTAGVEILTQARRPLVIFPEGVISRHNDRLNSMMAGTAFIAQAAAKKRAAARKRTDADSAAEVVVHPVAIRYHFHGDIEQALHPVLDDIEQRFSWRPKRELELVDRIVQVGEALLCLKEIEYLGRPQSGTIFERAERLIDHLLVPLEQEWLKGRRESTTVGRVKQLRIAILPDMVQNTITPLERDRRWKHLADMYLAQQIACFPPDYIRSNPTKERLLETVERFEEDLRDDCRMHRPMTATVTIGPPIAVNPVRERGAAEDPLMSELDQQLHHLLGIARPNNFALSQPSLAS